MTDSFDFRELVHPSTVPEASENSAGAGGSRTDVLEALHVYRAAEAAMRRRTGAALGLGENDVLALQFILDNHATHRTVASKDLTRYLGISSASTTVLLHRLERSGFIERRPSGTDRRSIEIYPTSTAEEGPGPMLAAVSRHAAEVTEPLTEEEAGVVIRFLTAMRQSVDRVGRSERG